MRTVLSNFIAMAMMLVITIVYPIPAAATGSFTYKFNLVELMDTHEGGPRIPIVGDFKLEPGLDEVSGANAILAADILRPAVPRLRIPLDQFTQVWYLTKDQFTLVELVQLMLQAHERVLVVDSAGGIFRRSTAAQTVPCVINDNTIMVIQSEGSLTLGTHSGCLVIEVTVYDDGRPT